LLRAVLKPCLRLGLAAVPTRVYQRLFPRDVIGLCYHMVTDEYLPHVVHVCPYKTSAQFEADLEYLTTYYEVISYEELRERRDTSGAGKQVSGFGFQVSGNGRRPASKSRRPAAILTFDDGYRECFEVVRPLLLKYEVPAIFFVTTDFIDNRCLFYRNKISLCIDRILSLTESEWREVTDRLERHGIIPEPAGSQLSALSSQFSTSAFSCWLSGLDQRDEPLIDQVCDALDLDIPQFLQERRPYLMQEEIQSLHAHGFTIGAHGRYHIRLGSLEKCAEVETEIEDSCRIIGEISGCEQVPFAFPFGGRGVPVNDMTEIRSRNPHVGMVFDSRGLLGSDNSIVHRISSDDSDAECCDRSNLPQLISDAYQRQFRRRWIEPVKRKWSVA